MIQMYMIKLQLIAILQYFEERQGNEKKRKDVINHTGLKVG